MSQPAIEKAASALVDFEEELGRIKQRAVETRKRLSAIAEEQSLRAQSEVLAQAQAQADGKVAAAKGNAEKEAAAVIAKGEDSLKVLRKRISSKKESATELVIRRLLGE